ncbi:MAG: hypothetical protein A2386_03640 [Elusimicrobia bacterium RIFOXYB1_FULL_48_9]|nr:MAG: hypothetical protein A2386_03640 [Elusimicrobia bacterium RIFOXYB1_FULL_48_9]
MTKDVSEAVSLLRGEAAKTVTIKKKNSFKFLLSIPCFLPIFYFFPEGFAAGFAPDFPVFGWLA